MSIAVLVISVVMSQLCNGATVKQAMPDILVGVQKILFYGDSLTDGSDYPDYVVNTLDREFPEVKFELMNAAICGDMAADLCRRLKADVLARKPDLVCICICTNFRPTAGDLAAYAADMETLVTTLKAQGIKVLLIKPSPCGDQELEDIFQKTLAVIQQVADRHKLIVADAHNVFLDDIKAGKEMLGADGVHHGKDGFEGMARAVLDAFGLKGVVIEKAIHPWPYLLLEWETSAPVTNQEPYEPAKATGWKAFDRAAAVRQQPWSDAPFAARGGWMPFAIEKAGKDMVAYGRTYYVAPRAGKAEMRLGGSSSPQVVWLNGKQVWKSADLHGYHPDHDRIEVDLQAGKNEIIVMTHYMAFVGIRMMELSSPHDANGIQSTNQR